MTMSKFWSAIRCSCGQRGQCVAAEVLRYPALHWPGADATVELDRRCVPVQHVPGHVDALAFQRDAGHVAKQREPDAAAAERAFDEDVFDEQAVAAGERAEGEIPQGEADRRTAGFGQDGFEWGRWVEQCGVELGFGDVEAVLQLFVSREVAHEAMQYGDVGAGGGAEDEGHADGKPCRQPWSASRSKPKRGGGIVSIMLPILSQPRWEDFGRRGSRITAADSAGPRRSA